MIQIVLMPFCTAGTSLLNNLKNASQEIQQLLKEKNWNQLSLWLLDQDNSSRVCGAEINSVSSIVSKGFLDRNQNLIFLVSDTDEGCHIGQLLKLYYQDRKNPIKFDQVDFRVLEGLRDDNIVAFKRQGLRNLVKEISEEVNKFEPSSIAINATGGYKAQISFAAMIGQALEIPVYYLFEKFSEIIELPPQPISLNLAFWLENYTQFSLLESEEILRKTEVNINWEDRRWLALIDEEPDNGNSLVFFSAMGFLFNTQARLQFKLQQIGILSLIPKNDILPEQKEIKLRKDHGIDELQAFSRRLCHSPYVLKIINSLPFNPKQVDPIRKCTENGLVEFVLTWTDQGLGICIQTTGRNLIETSTIALHLKDKYAR